MVDKINYTWDQLEDDVAFLSTSIQNSFYRPTKIIGIMRGGIIPAVMLSHDMGIPVEALYWSKRDFQQREFGKYLENIVVNAINARERFLIVDDILDSGETIAELKHYADKVVKRELWQDYIKYAVLWKNTACDVDVDYAARSIDRDLDSRWIVFPFE